MMTRQQFLDRYVNIPHPTDDHRRFMQDVARVMDGFPTMHGTSRHRAEAFLRQVGAPVVPMAGQPGYRVVDPNDPWPWSTGGCW